MKNTLKMGLAAAAALVAAASAQAAYTPDNNELLLGLTPQPRRETW